MIFNTNGFVVAAADASNREALLENVIGKSFLRKILRFLHGLDDL